MICLSCEDGEALIGYAGLGLTAYGRIEPCDWLARALNGPHLPLEATLAYLVEVVRDRLPRLMRRLEPAQRLVQHHFVAVALRKGRPCRYRISYSFDRTTKAEKLEEGWLTTKRQARFGQRGPALTAAGSGICYTTTHPDEMKMLKRIVKACEAGSVSPSAVAKQMASINFDAHSTINTIGPRSIVAWRLADGSAGMQYFRGTTPETPGADEPMVPHVARGLNIDSIARVMMESLNRMSAARRAGLPISDEEYSRRDSELAALTDKPNVEIR